MCTGGLLGEYVQADNSTCTGGRRYMYRWMTVDVQVNDSTCTGGRQYMYRWMIPTGKDQHK